MLLLALFVPRTCRHTGRCLPQACVRNGEAGFTSVGLPLNFQGRTADALLKTHVPSMIIAFCSAGGQD